MKQLKTLKKLLIGQTAGLDEYSDDEFYKITDIQREVIEFEGEKDNNYKIVLKGAEPCFVHSSATQELLDGEDISVHLKSNYKGGSLMLIPPNPLADKFCRILKDWLKDLFPVMVEDHKADNYVAQDVCISHEYCDPNQAMIDAFNAVYYREPDIQSDKDNALINTAWNLAKQKNFQPWQ